MNLEHLISEIKRILKKMIGACHKETETILKMSSLANSGII